MAESNTGSQQSSLKQNPSTKYVGLYHPTSGTYYHDFSETQEYQDALAKYKDHPLYQNLVNMPGLRGSYSPQFFERVAGLLGVDTAGHQNWYSSAYSAFQQNLSNIVQQMESTTYNSPEETVKRENAAGINSDINGGPQSGFGVTDEEHPGEIPNPGDAAAAAEGSIRGPVDVLVGTLSFLLTNGLQLANGVADLRSKKLTNALSRVGLRSSVRDSVLGQVVDNLKSNFPDLDELDRRLRDDPSNADPDFLEQIVDSLASSNVDFGDRLLNREARRYFNVFKGNNLRYRTEAYRQLRSYYQERYGAASEAARPGFRRDDSEFNDMVGAIGDKFYKYFDQYVEWDAQLRKAQATISNIEARRASATGTKEHVSREAELKKAQEELALTQTQLNEAETSLFKEIDDYLKNLDTWYAPILRTMIPLARGFMHQAGSTMIDRLIPHRYAPRGNEVTSYFDGAGELVGGTTREFH